MKRITFDVDDDLFYDIKLHCAKNKVTIKEFLTNLVKKEISE